MKQAEKNASQRRGSILWKHMIMMLSILLLAVTVLVVIHQISLKTLTEENLTSMERNIERNCSQMETDMFMTVALPSGIEETRYYNYLKSENTGYLDIKFYPVMSFLRKALNNQVYLRGSSDLTLLYLSGVNSVVSTGTVNADAEKCFTQNVVFSQTGAQVLLGYLRQRNCQMILPMQLCSIDGGRSEEYLTLIMHPLDQNIAVMSLYCEQTILNYLDIQTLPEGTCVQLTAGDGRVLMQYPRSFEEAPQENSFYELRFSLAKLDIDAVFRIPRSYFHEILRPLRRIGSFMILFVLLTGIALSFFLSRESVKPFRQLISAHGTAASGMDSNEIRSLDLMLSSASQRTAELTNRLSRQILARIMSGAAPTMADEAQLQGSGLLPDCFRAALIHADVQIQQELNEKLAQSAPDCVSVQLSQSEACVILPAAGLEQLTKALTGLENQISCGISAATVEISGLLTAAHQARAAMPQRGVQVFFGESGLPGTLSWLQHERLYQSIFSANQAEAEYLLSAIARRANYANIKELFFNIRFILRSAAEEMGVQLPDGNRDFQPDRTPQENIEALQSMLQALMSIIREQQKVRTGDRQAEILDHIAQNASDSELCAAKVARCFEVNEKRIYDAVRQATGMSFNEYLLAVRMKQAGKLLCNTQLEVGKISSQCGYQSSSTFYRAFNKFYGISPGDFRRSGGTEPVAAADGAADPAPSGEAPAAEPENLR